MQAVKDAAADTSIGAAIPAPLTCIHVTPAWNLTQFFTLANQNNIPYDAICQSYYPIFHGPLTDAQAVVSNPGNKPVEQDVLVAAVNNMGKPIFLIETGEHYENGFQSNDSWYAPPSVTLQRQFLLDLQSVQEGLPNNLGMGIEYWNPAGVNIPNLSGGFFNGDNLPDAIYTWNGLELFNNADGSGTTNVNDPGYSELFPAVDALGGKLDLTLSYKLINRSSAMILSVYQASNSAGALLDAEADSGRPGLSSTEQEWNVVSVGNGYFNLVNRLSNLVLDTNGGSGALAGFVVQETASSSTQTQQWQIVPVH
jgi:hypothetical protein